MDDKKRARLAIILAFAVFAIVPLLIGIIVLMVQINSRVSRLSFSFLKERGWSE